MGLDFGFNAFGDDSFFGKRILKDETFTYSQYNTTDIAGQPAGDYPEGTIFINTSDNRVYMAITGSTAAETPSIAWWKFDETAGNATDSSANSHTGTNVNTVDYVTGKYNNCADMERATSEHFTVASDAHFDFDANWTIEFWMNFNSKTGNDYAILYRAADGNNIYSLFLETTGHLQLYWVGNTVVSNGFISLDSEAINTWHHYAIVGDRAANKMLFYVDGIFKGDAALADDNMVWAGDTIYIGSGGGADNFDGKIDDMKIWNTTRSQSQIASDMSEGGTPSGTSWLYWDMIPA